MRAGRRALEARTVFVDENGIMARRLLRKWKRTNE
jgi:hypothetical protein